MKIALALVILMFMVPFVGLEKAEAIVSNSPPSQRQNQNETVRGVFKGYKNGVVHMALEDGSSRAYLFQSDNKSLLKTIATTWPRTRVLVRVQNGVVVGFERVQR